MADVAATQENAQPQATAPEIPQEASPAVEVQQPELTEVSDQGGRPGGQIDLLLDSTMPVAVRLGEVDLPVRRLLQLTAGSVIALDKQIGEPIDLYLRGVRFATGYLVTVNNQMGVRIKEIIANPG